MKQLCDDLRQFAHEVYQLGYSLEGGGAGMPGSRERMLAAVNQAEARMVSTKFARRAQMRC
jgi:hypothetical protein